MERKLVLSDKSKTFLEDLRAYLFSAGKNEKEIDGIVNELEVHLAEAEQNGKAIEKVVGNSPKEYMKMVSQEMTMDYRTWGKYLFIIIFGTFAFSIYQNVLNGPLSYSVLEIIGHIVIILLSLLLIFSAYRFIAGKNYSTPKQIMVLAIPASIPLALFLGLIFLNKAVASPVIHFGTIGSSIIVAFVTLIIIVLSVRVKSWIIPIFIALSTLPEYVFSKTTLNMELQLIFSILITYGGIGIYLFYMLKKYKN